MFNQEQEQAECMEHLLDLKKAVEFAISVIEVGPLRPITDAERIAEGPIELEPGGIIVAGWYCSRIKKL